MDTQKVGQYFAPDSYEQEVTCIFCNSQYVAKEEDMYIKIKYNNNDDFTVSECQACNKYTDLESVPGIVRERIYKRPDCILFNFQCDCLHGCHLNENSVSYKTVNNFISVKCPVCEQEYSNYAFYWKCDKRRLKVDNSCCIIL
tara:strand:- start:1547 stop:1975 length:429 start_codon:yes stop_codon:yes gene_type:complete